MEDVSFHRSPYGREAWLACGRIALIHAVRTPNAPLWHAVPTYRFSLTLGIEPLPPRYRNVATDSCNWQWLPRRRAIRLRYYFPLRTTFTRARVSFTSSIISLRRLVEESIYRPTIPRVPSDVVDVAGRTMGRRHRKILWGRISEALTSL